MLLYCRPKHSGIVTDSHFFWHKQGNKQTPKIATGSSNRAKRVLQASVNILLLSDELKELYCLRFREGTLTFSTAIAMESLCMTELSVNEISILSCAKCDWLAVTENDSRKIRRVVIGWNSTVFLIKSQTTSRCYKATGYAISFSKSFLMYIFTVGIYTQKRLTIELAFQYSLIRTLHQTVQD